MKKRNLLIILALVLVIALAAALALVLPRQRTTLKVVAPDGTQTPLPDQTSDGTAVQAAEGAKAYLLITVDGKTYAPYPLTQTGRYTVSQGKKGAKNVIYVTPDSVAMESSTCDNQLCVGEGTVTLDNKATRILGNYIMCLPNGVTLELLSAAEVSELTAGNRQ